MIYENKIIVKYERKDFFGKRVYTEDSINNYKKDDLKKAFLFLSKNNAVTVQKENIVYFWDNHTEYENRILTIRIFDGSNYTEEKKAFDLVKKDAYTQIHL